MKKFIATAAFVVAGSALAPMSPVQAQQDVTSRSTGSEAAKSCSTVKASAGVGKYVSSRYCAGTWASKVTYTWSSKKKVCVKGWGYKAGNTSSGLKGYWSKAKCAKKGSVTVTWVGVDATPTVKAKVASGSTKAAYTWRAVSQY